MGAYGEYKRRALVPLAGLGLVAYYLFVFTPLAHRSQSYDLPLQKSWRKLAAALDQPTNTTSIDFEAITNQLKETQQTLAKVENAKKQAIARLELPTAVRAKFAAPFQLVEYENERRKQMEDLEKAAKASQLTVDPLVLAGFPEHTADIREPALLWAALALSDQMLETAVACRVSALHSLEVTLALTNFPTAGGAGRWAEIPLQLEFTAPGSNALMFIRSLPLRTEEIRAANLPPGPAEKAPLFIDRFIIKKQTPEKPDEVRVWLRAVGFASRE